MTDAGENLFSRAAAAITEAARLAAENKAWQAEVRFSLRRMVTQMSFHPKSLKLYSSLEFPEPRGTCQPFPSENENYAPRE
ncbi:hypothetical protein [Bradyrhizobium neotropicale]|uniref:hypothetical protein n=1 Tax=Bradyrhizobium neotropicale TaxID=1497615 RepID=UPI001AD71C35|nr:hypothetical protein [Bradyrhizobium neotropicale]MBO4226658.1 hypothetical protein [Bradyrhizobium neotropicale]